MKKFLIVVPIILIAALVVAFIVVPTPVKKIKRLFGRNTPPPDQSLILTNPISFFGFGNSDDPVLLAAGDISLCDNDFDEATAKLLDEHEGTIAAIGDTVYVNGTTQEYADCYEPTWGRHKDRTKPAVGNHEYNTEGASGYFDYFGGAAGDPNKGYYSYDIGAWHIVVLNSNCDEVECGAQSEQNTWLRDDLAASDATCTLAYMHHPRFTSSHKGENTNIEPLWEALYDFGVDVSLAGHAHDYERFAPQDYLGNADPSRGIRLFIVGTGGAVLRPFAGVKENSEARDNTSHGILKLTLHDTSYDWEFVPVEGDTFTDSGTGTCH